MGLRIRKIRLENNLTQEEFSNLLGVKQANLSNIENKGSKLSLDLMNQIISKFNIDANWLLTGNGKMLRNEQNIGDISNSNVFGANISCSEVGIPHKTMQETNDDSFRSYTEIIKKQQEQITSLIAIINKLS